MNAQQRNLIFSAVLHANAIDAIAAEYIKTKLRINVTPAQRTMIASEFRHACMDFLRRDTRDVGAEYREQAETLERALGILQADPDHFASLMNSGDGGACRRRALESIAQVAADFQRMASMHERDARNKTFFYMLGRRWTGAKQDDAELPLPSARQALGVYQVLLAAIEAESPALLQGMKTNYSADAEGAEANSGASEIRHLMKAGRSAGG